MPDKKTKTILNSIADGVFTVDKDFYITSFNRAAEKITGIPEREALNKPCCEVFRANICEGECALKKTLETKKPIVNQAVYIVNSKGARIPISISTAVLQDDSEAVVGGVETFRDLSIVEELRKELTSSYAFEDIISKNHQMQNIFDILPDVAISDSAVMINGDSGTGKELIARAIHNLSLRKDKPMVVVNCGALPDALLESELFGYKAGAFTDAKKDKPGRFDRAAGGTIFLDEIGDISPALQVRLLRVLQEKTFEPLGGTESVRADVRIVAATNKNLAKMVKKGTFREDLYYRINVVNLALPPLSERKEDIPLLIDHFITHFRRLRNKDISGISPEALAILMHHDFPGNIRELENIIEYSFVICTSGLIRPECLPENLRPQSDDSATIATSNLKELEAHFIFEVLKRNGWNRLAAARELGIHKSTLFRKIKSLNIRIPKNAT